MLPSPHQLRGPSRIRIFQELLQACRALPLALPVLSLVPSTRVVARGHLKRGGSAPEEGEEHQAEPPGGPVPHPPAKQPRRAQRKEEPRGPQDGRGFCNFVSRGRGRETERIAERITLHCPRHRDHLMGWGRGTVTAADGADEQAQGESGRRGLGGLPR